MKKIMRALAALLALILAMGATASLAEAAPQTPNATLEGQLTLEDLEALNATVHTRDGRVTFVEGPCTDAAVTGMEDAARVVESMIGLMGGDGRTRFEPWHTLTDTCGNRYYVFRQMYAGVTVSGGAVKVVTDADGAMLGLVNSVESELPEARDAEGITAEEAEALVIRHVEEAQNLTPDVLEGRTAKVVLPVNLELDMDAEEEKEESRFVWVVYTNNPVVSLFNGSDLPYLAHYVDMSGEYLYSLPTVIPGDEASASGYNAAYVFAFMEPVDYTGEVTLADGRKQEISLQLMRDARTGMVYLGNLERRIAVADCHEFLYNKGHVVLEASKDNTGWDETCLMALYNYCRAWDYYKAIGWKGGDGLGTPMLILKDYCDKDHNPIDNAAYAGRYYGWQVFLSSDINKFSQCLDVLAHEFTHCVTGSVMTYNAYMNDYGAINEAMSDIQGNICDHMYMDEGEKADPEWLLGEDIDQPIRSMSDPHRYKQPEYTWDIHYVPHVKAPTELNDRGGVHSNSSLLNYLAWRVIEKGGMTLEEARAFWFAVDCSMVPGTDYAQLSELMPWVLKNLGMDRYQGTLEAAIDVTRIRIEEMPETFDDDRALLTLTLPDTELYEDGNWALGIFSVNVDGFIQRAIDILDGAPGYENSLDELVAVIDPEGTMTKEDLPGLIAEAAMAVMAGFGEETEDAEASEAALEEAALEEAGGAASTEGNNVFSGVLDWVRRNFGDIVYMGTGAAGQDGRTVRMVCRPGLTVPVLLRMEFKPNSMQLKTGALAVYCGRWFDLGGMVTKWLTWLDADDSEEVAEADDAAEEAPDLSFLGSLLESLAEGMPEEAPVEEANLEFTLEDMRNGLTAVQQKLNDMSWLTHMFLYEIKPGEVCTLRPDGLEKVTVLEEDVVGMLLSE